MTDAEREVVATRAINKLCMAQGACNYYSRIAKGAVGNPGYQIGNQARRIKEGHFDVAKLDKIVDQRYAADWVAKSNDLIRELQACADRDRLNEARARQSNYFHRWFYAYVIGLLLSIVLFATKEAYLGTMSSYSMLNQQSVGAGIVLGTVFHIAQQHLK